LLVVRLDAAKVTLRAAWDKLQRFSVRAPDMADDDDVELEFSPLSGDVTRDGITVRVEIYRIVDSGDGWSLEVIDQDQASTVWDDRFPTDAEAYAEFYKTVEEEGIASFAERPAARRISRLVEVGNWPP
jgi:hypothetical protein